MAAYLKRHTEVSGELMLSDRIVNLVEEGIDLAAADRRPRRLQPDGAPRRRHAPGGGGLARLPCAARRAAEPGRSCARHDTITFGGLGDSVAWRFVVGGEEQRVMVASRYTTNSADSAVWYAAEGGGLAMVLAYQAADAIKEGRLQIVLAAVRAPGAADPVRLSGLAAAVGEGAHLRRSCARDLPLGVRLVPLDFAAYFRF